MARLVQLVITDGMSELTAAALRDAANSEDVTVDEADVLYNASLLFQAASESPEKFPLTGKMATSLPRAIRRRGKAPGNSGNTAASVRNRRKARQESRQGWAKTRRKNRAAMVENFNQAREIMEAEQAEMEMIHAEEMAKLADQPKFDVFGMDGSRLLGGIPESMIRPVETAQEAEPQKTDIILP